MLLVTALAIPVLVFGVMPPGRVIDSGFERYEGEKGAFACATLAEMRSTNLGGTSDACVAVAHRIVNTGRCASPRAFRMEVRLYTIFGIPYGQEKTACIDRSPG